VKKWTLLDQALTPDGKTISLHEHDGSFTIRVDGAELMSTRRQRFGGKDCGAGLCTCKRSSGRTRFDRRARFRVLL